jgi:hypothetical protein
MIEQHHLLEETIICEYRPSRTISCSILAVPRLEPGMKTDMVDEYASFAKPFTSLVNT